MVSENALRSGSFPDSVLKQQGVALLAVLILILALVVTLGNIFYRHQLDVSRMTNMMHEEQAQLLAFSVENWARQLLSSEYDERESDDFFEDWAQAVPALPVEGGFISGCLVDLQGRYNLNSLSSYNDERWDEEMQASKSGLARVWLNLLENLELPADEAQVVSVIDWVDGNRLPLNQWGAEQSYYDAGVVWIMVPNMMMTDVAELSVIKGYDAARVQVLTPYISALPDTTPININTASPELLIAIGADKGAAFADFVSHNRPFDSYDSFMQQVAQALGLEDDEAAGRWGQNTVGVNSDYFQLQLQVSLGEVELEVTSVLDRAGRDEPVVISRSISRVPNIDTSQLDNDVLAILASPCVNDSRTAS